MIPRQEDGMRIAGVEQGVTEVPIVIFAFDRPDYLAALCRGLLAQTQVKADPTRVHLVQDGAVSARTGRRHARPADIARSVAVFREHFPQGQVHAAPHNLGIAENILRGQVLAFETLDAPVAYFFEDDLEPGPLYLAALEAMRKASEPFTDRVAYFAAYGDRHAALQGPVVRWRPLANLWGFGLRREAWRSIQDWLQPWWAEIRRNDYRARNQLRIMEFWRTKRIARNATSQDGAMEAACADLGLARVSTDVCFARYIGATGQHFSPEKFRLKGFETMRWAEQEVFTFAPFDEAIVTRFVAGAFRAFETYRRDRLEAQIAELQARMDDPDRLATEAEIRALWHLLLDRRDVPAPYLARHAGRSTIRAVRRELVRHQEFQRITGP
jgi:hypothetical protein